MFMEIERRSPPQKWVSRGQTGKTGKLKPVAAGRLQFRAETVTYARGAEAGSSKSFDETQGLLRKLQLHGRQPRAGGVQLLGQP